MSETTEGPGILERLAHFERHQRRIDNEYGAEVLHHARMEIIRLRKLEAEQEGGGMAVRSGTPMGPPWDPFPLGHRGAEGG